MDKGEQKYKNLVLEGTWNKLTQEQEEIIALRAQVDQAQEAHAWWRTRR